MSEEGELLLEQRLGKEWYGRLRSLFDHPKMIELKAFLKSETDSYDIYPPAEDVFSAFKLTPCDKVRVIIMGQDLYINFGEAHGLAFSTKNESWTPTLRQIEKALKRDTYVPADAKWCNNLTRWADQGVMLLNASLTVRAGQSNSHKDKWDFLIGNVLSYIDMYFSDIIFCAWGKDSERLIKNYITRHPVLTCEHPVAASYQNRLWDNKNCFNQINELLKDNPINWY